MKAREDLDLSKRINSEKDVEKTIKYIATNWRGSGMRCISEGPEGDEICQE